MNELWCVQTLLDLPEESVTQEALAMASCYAAEAQAALGNVEEAGQHLNSVVQVGQISCSITGSGMRI